MKPTAPLLITLAALAEGAWLVSTLGHHSASWWMAALALPPCLLLAATCRQDRWQLPVLLPASLLPTLTSAMSG